MHVFWGLVGHFNTMCARYVHVDAITSSIHKGGGDGGGGGGGGGGVGRA